MDLSTTIGKAHENTFDYLISKLVLERDLIHRYFDAWSSDVIPLDQLNIDYDGQMIGSMATTTDLRYAVEYGKWGMTVVVVENGSAYVTAYSETPAGLPTLMAMAREFQEAHVPEDGMAIPIQFWSYSDQHGAISVRRDLDGLCWEDVQDNYAASIRDDVAGLLNPNYRPSTAGQLLLWTGPPGTGKTTALRALAYEWREWCNVHYIADPEKFFGTHADYMIQVLLREEGNKSEKALSWKLLVLEDAGEFLQPSAKIDASSPALARFLNVVDGLIGRGLRILVLVTTNEKVAELHEAVRRPGRCAADIRFVPLSEGEAVEWVTNRGGDAEGITGDKTIADLYAHIAGGKTDKRRTVGFAS